MNCIVCGSNRTVGSKCQKCGFDFTKEEMFFVFKFDDKEHTFFRGTLDSKNNGVDCCYSNRMTYSQYISELKKLCTTLNSADFDIPMFIHRNRLDFLYGITVADVKKDIKTIIEPICKKYNIEIKTWERYSYLHQKYGCCLDYEEFKEFLCLEKKMTDLLTNGIEPHVTKTKEYFIRLEKLFKYCGTIPSDKVLHEFINDCVACNGPQKTIEEVKEDLVTVILGAYK